MKFSKSQFNQERYRLWESGLHVPHPPVTQVYEVIFNTDENKSDVFMSRRVEATSPEDAVERLCFEVSYGTHLRPEEIDVKSVVDIEDNLRWVDEENYHFIQKKHEFRGMGRREFFKRFGSTAGALLYALKPESAQAIIPFAFMNEVLTIRNTSGKTNWLIDSTYLKSNGWNTSQGPSVVIINEANINSSDVTKPAIEISVSMSSKNTLTFINKSGCTITGKGGAGGAGNNNSGDSGQAGGDGLYAKYAVRIFNYGTIAGGGGGGGGGGGWFEGGGGGGGGGAGDASSYGKGGAYGVRAACSKTTYTASSGSSGSAGGTNTYGQFCGGNGGSGGTSRCRDGVNAAGTSGGSGGTVIGNSPGGSGGSPGTQGTYGGPGGGGGGGGGQGAAGGGGGGNKYSDLRGGSGGIGGNAVTGNSNIIWKETGTRVGTVK